MRLPMKQDGLKLLANHDWYKGFDWDELIMFSMLPPMKIRLRSNADCSNFFVHEDDMPPHIPYGDDMTKGTAWDKFFATE